MAMLGMGRLFPRSDRSPAILPVRERLLRDADRRTPAHTRGSAAIARIVSGFYTSQAMEVLTA